MNTIIDAMEWRYATREFDTSKKLTDEQLTTLLDAMVLAPSSFGLQPWKFIVVTNPEIRTQLMQAGYGQEKIAQSSHLIVLAAKTNIDDNLVDEYIQSVSEIRGAPVDALKGYADIIKGSIARMTQEQRTDWAVKQTYIALGVLMAAAGLEKIDAAPMEGFDAKKFNEILGLDALSLTTAVIASVGFRSEHDANAHYKKVRFPKDKVIIEMK